MSLWSRISDALAALGQGESLAEVFDRLRAPPERTVGFAIAVIALGAKMAKADGRVTRDEVTAFREVFQIARNDEAGAARVFDMARTDVAGYQDYAARIQRMFASDPTTLCDLMEGLFHIAMADGFYHPGENEFLQEVSRIFGQCRQSSSRRCARALCRMPPRIPIRCWGSRRICRVTRFRKHWRQRLVRETHPGCDDGTRGP